MRFQGRITQWKDEQGFGFITPNSGGERLFLHIRAFSRGQPRPGGDEIVTYEMARDDKGRPRAAAVQFVRPAGQKRTATGPGSQRWPLALAALFLGFLVVSTLAGKLPPILPVFYGGISVVAFVAYALDKSAARNGRWRTQENTLHLLALAGGWPGALVAQQKLRHKSAKPSFLVVFWATVLLNCGALAWLLTPAGGQTLHRLLASI
ncbi:MAG: DUF1294 domain-containing protein [Betaproteobacteria bacterium HGW-Betaproteobacteria-7]|jgi:uncharacterized membrane protein YsdA (DUF1294 family)/cold shock CspA family protein|nr:MAG: DUF1294 domain-containing protein [Betaproteobacteria bacterium HGW-Betaproteobacteria-7]